MSYLFATDSAFIKAARLAKKDHSFVDVHSIESTQANCTDIRYYLADDAKSGFGVSSTGELVSVFSAVRGRGYNLVKASQYFGANNLNCWELPQLVELYRSRGFVITKRVPNWNYPKDVGVVYMALPNYPFSEFL